MAVDPTTSGAPFRASSGPDLGSGAGVPPHDLEAESSVLGSIMLAERWLDPLLIDVGLRPDDFYRERHRLIYRAIIKLQEASEPIDTLTVSAQLAENGELEEAGGKEYVETLVERIPAIANTRQYGQIVKENALLRNLLRASQEIQESISSREGDPKELLERAQQRVFEVAQDNQSGDFRSIGDILHDELEKLEKQSLEGAALTGTPSGFRDIDELTGGFQKGNLIIVAARPSMGKSALVTNIAENAALDGFPVALFSLEMSQTELAQRFVASQAKIDGDALRKGKVKKDRWPAVLKAAAQLSESPLWIDDSSDINILELRAKARRLHGKAMAQNNGEGLGLVIVDYLQLLRANDSRESRVEQVAQISRGLKVLARELDIPVIAVSQLSRAVESRHPPRPQLSDLRECVAGDTLVWLADGRRVPIEELVGRSIDVLAVDDEDRVIASHCDKVWRVGRKRVFELRLASGRKLRATAKHRVRTDLGWVEVGDLTEADRLAVATDLPWPASDWAGERNDARRISRVAYSSANYSSADTLPIETRDRVERAMREQAISRGVMAGARDGSRGGTAHLKLAPSRETIRDSGAIPDDPEPAPVGDSMLIWDRVTEITPGGVEDVYDLTVPGPANWLANDGIVTHNSGQIEQDADLVAFIYREDYYLRDESQRPGEADIIVSKHRNGPVRDVALTFISHYPKFSNLPRGYSDGVTGGGGPSAVQAAPVADDDGDLDEF
ncbi:MAG: replicative DNA helicase [Solirubrobacterales bacterium]